MTLYKKLEKYIHNTGYLFLDKFVKAFVMLIVWAQVVKYLGPEQFGIFSYALSFIYLFGVLSFMGIESVVVKELVDNEEFKNSILGVSFIVQLFGSVLAIVLIWMTTNFLSMSTPVRTAIHIMSVYLIFQPLKSISFYFQANVLSKYVVFSQVASYIVTTVLCLTFIYLKRPLIYFVFIVVFEMFIAGVGMIFFYLKTGNKIFSWKFDFNTTKQLMVKAWPVIITGAAVSIYHRIDQVMIKAMLGTASVGFYAASVRISEFIYFIPVIITGSLFPAIVKSRRLDRESYMKRIWLLFAMLAWIAVGLSVLLAVLSPYIVNKLYGSEFYPSASVLSIHVWASIFIFLGVARNKWAINENLQIYIMGYAIFGALLNVVLNLILLPAFSIQGAAIATLISYFVAGMLSNSISPKTREIFVVQMNSFNIRKLLREKRLM